MEIKRFIGGLLEANCFVIRDTKADRDCLIIDPGYEAKKIMKYMRDENLNPLGIVLTHHHHDHSGAAEKLAKELELEIMIHTDDADSFESPGRLLSDGDVLELGKDKLVICHTPGHTRGSICLYSKRSSVCFTGDTVFNVDLGRTDLEDGSEEEMKSSIREVVNKWGNQVTIYPGHGDPATMKYVRKYNTEFIELAGNKND
ncbi:MAG: MBL fold metallo-hydrolase [Eubacteriales bacterium]|nr:MBL fold metallo-hydrolase [Eubacteriales bacterium]